MSSNGAPDPLRGFRRCPLFAIELEAKTGQTLAHAQYIRELILRGI